MIVLVLISGPGAVTQFSQRLHADRLKFIFNLSSFR